MADEFSNPADRYREEQLLRELRQASSEARANIREGRETRATVSRGAQRIESATARATGERIRQQQAAPSRYPLATRGTPLAGGGGVLQSPAEQIRQQGERIRGLDREIKATERLAVARKAAAEQTRRSQLLLGPGPGPTSFIAGPGGVTNVGGRGGPPPTLPPTAAAGAADDDSLKRRAAEFVRTMRASGQLTDELEGLDAQQARLLDQSREFERTYSRQNAAIQRSGVAVGLATDKYRQHGAMTTEFLEAARRGEVDIRELGYQATATIGKFAGWTAAASAVFGVAAAIGQMGSGALDSLNGVNQLQRIIGDLDTEKAQQDFRDLSNEFNLPVGEVAGASYEMSKIFQDQKGTLEGARAALFAVKVGELEQAEATRYLTSIINGANLESADLATVMDQVNEATNRFGGNVGQMTQGVANATGAFTAAGGSVRELIALVQTGQRVTGRSGSEIGTALRRTAEIIQRPERRATILDLLGIDPRDASVTEVLTRAAKLLETAGPDLRSQILRTITTPELASGRILPILQNFDLYKRINQAIAPDRARGSAERELQRTLRAPGEEIKEISTNLQQLGSALAQAGALDPFVAMLKTLNLTLDSATSLLEIFTELPRPLRSAVAFLGQGAIAVALMRRFDVGRYLPGAAGNFLQRNPAALERATLVSGLRDTRTALGAERRSATGVEIREKLRSESLQARYYADLRQGNLTDAEIATRQAEVNTAKARTAEAERHRVFLTEEENRVNRQIGTAQRSVTDARQVAAYSPGSLGRPAAHDPVPVGGAGGRPLAADLAAARGLGQAAAGVDDVAKATRATSEGFDHLGRTGRVMDTALLGTYAAAQKADLALRSSGGRLRQLASQFSASSGPANALDGLLIGLTTAYFVYQEVSSSLAEADKRINDLERITVRGSTRQIERAAARELNDPGDLLEQARTVYANAYNALAGLPGSPLANVQAESPQQRTDAEARRAQDRADAIANANRQGAELRVAEIKKRLDRRLGQAKTEEQREKALADAQLSFEQSREAIGARSQAARDRAWEAGRRFVEQRRRSFINQPNTLQGDLDLLTDPEQFEQFGARQQVNIERFGLTRRSTRSLAGMAARLRERAADYARAGQDDKALQAISEAEGYQQAIIEEAEKRLQRSLASARTPAQAQRARSRYLRTTREAMLGGYRRRLRATTEEMEERQRELRRLEREVDEIDSGPALGDAVRDDRGQRLGNRGEKGRRLTAAQKEATRRIKELRRSINRQRPEFEAIRREQQQQQLELELAAFDARTQRLQSATNDPLTQARILVARMRQRTAQIADGLRRGIQTQADLDRAIAEQNNALQQLVSSQLSRLQAQRRTATARFAIGADDTELLQRQLADARANLADAQRLGADPETILGLQEEVFNLQRQAAEQAKQQAEELLGALEELRLAEAGEDPIRQAQIRLAFARRRLALADTPAERISGRAEVINARRDLATSRQDERIADREFLFDIDKISREQLISFYERFLHNNRELRKTNRERWRELRRRLHALKNEGENDREGFELNVGDIRLPTVYDVRRAIAGGRRAGAGTVAMASANTWNITVNNDADADYVIGKIADTQGADVRAAARAAGVIG